LDEAKEEEVDSLGEEVDTLGVLEGEGREEEVEADTLGVEETGEGEEVERAVHQLAFNSYYSSSFFSVYGY